MRKPDKTPAACGKTIKNRFQPRGPTWNDRAKLGGLRAVLDPSDRTGRTNMFIDLVQRKAIATHCAPSSRYSVLDFGCGVGRLTKWLAGSVEHVVGVDMTRSMLDEARRSAFSSAVDYVLYDGLDLCFRRECFDLILSVAVLQYVQDRTLFMGIVEQLAYSAKKGGLVCMIEQFPKYPAGKERTLQQHIGHMERQGLKCVACHATPSRSAIPGMLGQRIPLKLMWLIARIAATLSEKGLLPKTLLGARYVEHVVVMQKE